MKQQESDADSDVNANAESEEALRMKHKLLGGFFGGGWVFCFPCLDKSANRILIIHLAFTLEGTSFVASDGMFPPDGMSIIDSITVSSKEQTNKFP